MFNVLKPRRPNFSYKVVGDTVVVTVSIPPRDKKRRVPTSVTDPDVEMYMETENIPFGALLSGPGYAVSNGTTNRAFHEGAWTYKLRDLRVGKKPTTVRKPVKSSKTSSSKIKSSKKTK